MFGSVMDGFRSLTDTVLGATFGGSVDSGTDTNTNSTSTASNSASIDGSSSSGGQQPAVGGAGAVPGTPTTSANKAPLVRGLSHDEAEQRRTDALMRTCHFGPALGADDCEYLVIDTPASMRQRSAIEWRRTLSRTDSDTSYELDLGSVPERPMCDTCVQRLLTTIDQRCGELSVEKARYLQQLQAIEAQELAHRAAAASGAGVALVGTADAVQPAADEGERAAQKLARRRARFDALRQMTLALPEPAIRAQLQAQQAEEARMRLQLSALGAELRALDAQTVELQRTLAQETEKAAEAEHRWECEQAAMQLKAIEACDEAGNRADDPQCMRMLDRMMRSNKLAVLRQAFRIYTRADPLRPVAYLNGASMRVTAAMEICDDGWQAGEVSGDGWAALNQGLGQVALMVRALCNYAGFQPVEYELRPYVGRSEVHVRRQGHSYMQALPDEQLRLPLFAHQFGGNESGLDRALAGLLQCMVELAGELAARVVGFAVPHRFEGLGIRSNGGSGMYFAITTAANNPATWSEMWVLVLQNLAYMRDVVGQLPDNGEADGDCHGDTAAKGRLHIEQVERQEQAKEAERSIATAIASAMNDQLISDDDDDDDDDEEFVEAVETLTSAVRQIDM